jgi:Tfp pilus assembly protein PilN
MTAYRYLVDTKETRAQITAIDEEAARERALAETMELRVAAIDAATLDDQARFINEQIHERAFSWSEMMSGLETLLPGDVRLTSLNPAVDDDGNVTLALECVSRREDGLLEGPGLHRISIQTTYLPSPEKVKK